MNMYIILHLFYILYNIIYIYLFIYYVPMVFGQVSLKFSDTLWKKNELDDGWPESLEEHSERCKYEDLMA